jgi:hypothetical protein
MKIKKQETPKTYLRLEPGMVVQKLFRIAFAFHICIALFALFFSHFHTFSTFFGRYFTVNAPKSCEKCEKNAQNTQKKSAKMQKMRKSAKCECDAKMESKFASHLLM